MRRSGKWTRWLGAGLAAFFMAAAPAAIAVDAKPWRHGIIEAKSDAGIVMMVGEGFAAKQGLALEIIQFKSDIPALQALLAGDLDSYEGGLGGAILAAAHGADVEVLGCYWGVMPQGLFVRADIATIADLKGKTIAISSPGSMPDLLARAVLDRYGVAADEVRFASLGNDLDRFKAITAGIADAGVISGEFETMADKAKIKLILPGREVLPNYLRFCLQTTGKAVASRREDAARFVAAEMTALHFVMDHRAETVALTRTITGAHADDTRPDYLYDFAVGGHALDPDLPIPVEKLAWMQEQLVKTGNLSKPVDIGRMVDKSVREQALAKLGR
jgi:NitT/TauT family transport system substrate-binding protein